MLSVTDFSSSDLPSAAKCPNVVYFNAVKQPKLQHRNVRKIAPNQNLLKSKIKWTPEEDQILVQYVKTHGKVTCNATKDLPRRNFNACQKRYNDYLKPKAICVSEGKVRFLRGSKRFLEFINECPEVTRSAKAPRRALTEERLDSLSDKGNEILTPSQQLSTPAISSSSSSSSEGLRDETETQHSILPSTVEDKAQVLKVLPLPDSDPFGLDVSEAELKAIFENYYLDESKQNECS